MTDDRNHLSCAAFQAQLAELIGTGEDISAHPHIQTCAQCRALLADLETIAEAARQLFPLEEEEPSDKLWDDIENAIKSDAAKPQPDLSTEPA